MRDVRHGLRRSVGRLALAAALLASASATAAERATLRGDVVAKRDTLTLGDLVENAPPALAGTDLFRAPSLGQTGTIQAHRILEAARGLGLAGIETGGRLQVAVSRAARRVGPGEIEAALKRALEKESGLDPRWIGITFDGAPPALVAAPDLAGEIVAGDVLFDRRSRRVSATIWLGPSPTERRASLAVAGSAVEMVEVATVVRPIERGEVVKAADIAVERRPKDTVAADSLFDGAPYEGRVARRALGAGGLVRAGDLMRAEIVARGEIVTMVYEVPGISLSLRGRASEAGALGDVISVINPSSRKAVQARIVAPGRVSVTAGTTPRIVASAASSQP